MTKKYNLFLSVGSWCASSQHLRKNGLQIYSYPFDWLSNMSIEKFYHLYKTNFSDFLIKKNLQWVVSDNQQFYSDKKSGLNFVHDFKQKNELNKNFEKIYQKYLRRINRMHQKLKSSKKILFVYSYTNEDDKYIKKEIEFFEKFCGEFKFTNIDLLIIQNKLNLKKIKINKISENITSATIGYTKTDGWEKSFENYKKLLADYRLIFSYSEKMHKVSQNIRKIVVEILCIFISNRETKRRLRARK